MGASSSNIRAPTTIMDAKLSPADQELLQAVDAGDWPEIQRALAKGAISKGDWKLASQIMKVPGFDATAKNEGGETLLHLLCGREPASNEQEQKLQMKLLRDLVKAGADPHLNYEDMCFLEWAVFSGNSKFVEYFLTFHEINGFPAFNELEINRAVLAAFEVWELSAECISLPVVSLLLEHGGSARLHHENGETPLHKAVNPSCGSEKIIRLLLDKGACPNAIDQDGETALHHVAKEWEYEETADEAVEIIKLLLEKGADRENQQGKTPLQITCLSELADVLENYIPASTAAHEET